MAAAEKVCEVLEKKGCKCWIAPRDVSIGRSYAKAIIDAIKASRVMVFVFSSSSNSSPHVMRELECAVKRDVHIIPFRIEDVEPSESIEYFVGALHWLDAFPQPEEKHFEILVDQVEKLLRGKERGPLPTGVKVFKKKKEVKPGVIVEQIPVGEYSKYIHDVEKLFNQKQWISCVRKCGTILEKGMRKLLSDLLDSSKDKVIHDKTMKAQEEIGKGKAGFKDFNLEQLHSLYKEAQIFDELRKYLTSNLQKIKMINWIQAVQWYSASKQEDSSNSLDEDDAQQMLFWTKIFVYDCELAGKSDTVKPVPGPILIYKDCPCCTQPLETDWNFCPECGVALKVVCEACQRPLAPDFQICPYCETPVTLRGGPDMDRVRKAKEEYRILCTGAYLDGVMNARERALLDKKRLELGLSADDVESIERQCSPANVLEYTHLVEGVLVDGKIDDAEAAFLQKKAEQMKIDSWLARQIHEGVIEKYRGI